MLATRRSFLAAGAAAAAFPQFLSAAEPIARSHGPQFKFSLAAYSYRNLLSGNSPQLTLFDFVNDCAKFGLEGTELTSYYFPGKLTDEFLCELKAHCFRQGLDVSGTAVGNDFGLAEPEKRRGQIDHVKQWVQHAALLGAPVIRIFAGHDHGAAPAEAHKLYVSAIEECCEFAGKHGVFLALENHGGPTSTAEGLLKIVKDVNSPWCGVNLDTGNFHSDDIYNELEEAAPYALNVQVKVVVSGPDKKKHPADFGRLAKILRTAGYRGYIVLEYEEAGDPRAESEKFLSQLREAFA